MSFKFKRGDSSLSDSLRRVARSQLKEAVTVCRRTDLSIDERIHEARRHCKKLRGLIRLVRPGFRRYAEVNAAVRDAADTLAGTRDAAVMANTSAGLRQWATAAELAFSGETWDRFDQSLTGQRSGSDDARSGDDLLADFSASMAALREQAADWSVEGEGFGVARAGLKDNYSNFRAAMRLARKSGADDDFHDWRKAVKYLGHHLSLLRPTAPDVLRPMGNSVDELGDLLGLHHDLAMLKDHAHDRLEAAEAAMITECATTRQNQLAGRAFNVGEQLAAEKPKAFANRVQSYWRIFRSK